MAKEVSKTQIDRLGDRLRKGDISEADLRLLDSYRRSFSDAYELVVGKIRKELSLEPTGRAKTNDSIIEKLRRESIRLTQIQDIAGCRLIVADMADQETVTQALKGFFERAIVIDRRQQPSHGYRAVHVIVNHDGKLIEIQVRTALQHLWAELSEKLSDVVDPAIKYGGGEGRFQTILTKISLVITQMEISEPQVADKLALLDLRHWLPVEEERQLVTLQESWQSIRQELFQNLHAAIELVEKMKG